MASWDPDELLQRRVYRPLVDLAWEWLGVPRKRLALSLAAGMVCTDAARHQWLAVGAGLFWATIILLMSISYDNSPFMRGFRLFFFGFAIVSTVMAIDPTFSNVVGAVHDWLFISLVYVLTVDDSKRKRRKWRERLHEWASQWTWLPAPAGA